jgi:type I restriction enzyme S subunit
MGKNNNKPKLRFPGFTDPWEQRKLGEISERITRKNTELESTLPLTISAQYGLVDQITFFNNRVASRDVSGYYLLKKGEFAYNKSYSEGYPWGAVKRLERYENGVLSTLYICFKLSNVNSNFLVAYYDTNNWYKEVAQRAAEGARNHGLLNISADDFFDTKLTIPKSKEEQDAIGCFFQDLDKLITLHQRKLNHLQDKKKSLLQKMFPKDGEEFPELRFPEFTDPWKQRKLGDICEEFKSGKNIKSEDIKENGAYPVYGGNGFRGYSNTYNHDGIYALIGRQGALCGNINISFGKAYFTEHAIAVRANKSNETRFLFYLLGKMNLGQYSGQSAQPGLAVNKLLELSSSVPNYDEQKQISKFFVLLDNLITLHQRKLNHLQEQKKALLQQMFA